MLLNRLSKFCERVQMLPETFVLGENQIVNLVFIFCVVFPVIVNLPHQFRGLRLCQGQFAVSLAQIRHIAEKFALIDQNIAFV